MYKFLRLNIFIFPIVCFFILIFSVNAHSYPDQPIQLIIPLSPGDTVDLAGRAIATEISKILKVPVIIINKPGGGGTIGADYVVRSKKDGYNILFAPSGIYYAHAVNPESVPYHPVKDLDPLCSAVSVPMMLPVLSSSPWKNFMELMNYVKQNPGKVRGGTTGVGSVGFFNFEVIRMETGNVINPIPFKGASPALAALLGGHIETAALTLGLIAPNVQAGKLRVLLTSQKVPQFPEVPTLKELGYKRDIMSVRFSFYLPIGVDDSIKKVLISSIEKVIKTHEIGNTIQQVGAIVDFIPADEYRKIMVEEYEMVRELMKQVSTPGR